MAASERLRASVVTAILAGRGEVKTSSIIDCPELVLVHQWDRRGLMRQESEMEEPPVVLLVIVLGTTDGSMSQLSAPHGGLLLQVSSPRSFHALVLCLQGSAEVSTGCPLSPPSHQT